LNADHIDFLPYEISERSN